MKKLLQETGALIVEASIVFPVMFLVIIFMIFLGNAYLQKCRVEAIVNELTMDGAAYCASPMLYKIEQNKKIPEFSELEVQPYRYLIGGMKDIKSWVSGQLEQKISGMSTGLFSGMKPKNWNINVNYHNHYIYSSFSIDLDYKITIPVKLLGESDFWVLSISSHSEKAVSDTTEFIRNVDMVEDYLESTGIKEKITEAKEKIAEVIEKVGHWKS